jgi:hypothetical protein
VSAKLKQTAIRELLLGPRVDRATAVLPATTQSAIYTVSGGRIIVTSLVGEVTVVCSGTATTLKVTSNPTTGTDVDLTSATAVTSKEVGSLITLPLTFGGALNVQSAGGGEIPGALGFVVPIGTIDLVTSATNTGSVKWSLTWLPFDDGASVVAA